MLLLCLVQVVRQPAGNTAAAASPATAAGLKTDAGSLASRLEASCLQVLASLPAVPAMKHQHQQQQQQQQWLPPPGAVYNGSSRVTSASSAVTCRSHHVSVHNVNGNAEKAKEEAIQEAQNHKVTAAGGTAYHLGQQQQRQGGGHHAQQQQHQVELLKQTHMLQPAGVLSVESDSLQQELQHKQQQQTADPMIEGVPCKQQAKCSLKAEDSKGLGKKNCCCCCFCSFGSQCKQSTRAAAR